jgi:3-phosphoshikimate 1-carboxyvinyltransferase
VYNKKELKAEVTVEPDWTSASFWYCLLSMAEKGEIFLPGLKKSGLQGDQQAAAFFKPLGVETIEESMGIRLRKVEKSGGNLVMDFSAHPDLALPVILACGTAGIEGAFTGLERLRIKESDRIAALSGGLLKTGLTLNEEVSGTWKLSGHLVDPCELDIDDFDDHRVAMTFACLAMKGFAVNLKHPEVVNKSYPEFWKDMEKAGFDCTISC